MIRRRSPREPVPLRPVLQRVVDELLTRHSDHVSLDAIGDALGALAVTTDEIDELISTLEDAGRQVGIEDEGSGIERLRQVLDAIRLLRVRFNRAPTPQEIREHTGLTAFAVQHALALARVMRQ